MPQALLNGCYDTNSFMKFYLKYNLLKNNTDNSYLLDNAEVAMSSLQIYFSRDPIIWCHVQWLESYLAHFKCFRYPQCAFETELASVNMTAKQLETQPTAGSDWTVFHASLRLLQAIGKNQQIACIHQWLDIVTGWV